MNSQLPDAVVIGAGVIGLTTGTCLAETGLRVRIRTAAPPAETTSAVAGALIGPVFAAPGHPPGDSVAAWERTGVSEFTKLAADPSTGAHLCRGLLAARPDVVAGGAPPLDDIPEVRLSTPDELPDGFGFGFWATLPLVDMRRYLTYLSERFAAAGGEIQVRPVTGLAEAAREARPSAGSDSPADGYAAPLVAVREVTDPGRPERCFQEERLDARIGHYHVLPTDWPHGRIGHQVARADAGAVGQQGPTQTTGTPHRIRPSPPRSCAAAQRSIPGWPRPRSWPIRQGCARPGPLCGWRSRRSAAPGAYTTTGTAAPGWPCPGAPPGPPLTFSSAETVVWSSPV
jgi:hypothetical protein